MDFGSQPSPTLRSISLRQQDVYDAHSLSHCKHAVRFLRIKDCVYLHGGNDSTKVFHCSFEVHELAPKIDDNASPASPTFVGLSYTWGIDDIVEDDTLFIDGVSWPLRRNLHEALHTILDMKRLSGIAGLNRGRQGYRSDIVGCGSFEQDSRLPLLWIDCLCIAQDNAQERNHQVLQMSHIFRLATTVVVWLGSATNDSSIAMGALNSLYQPEILHHGDHIIETVLKGQDMPTILTALHNLLSRDYWDRLWIAQEWILAREVLVFSGHDRFHASTEIKNSRTFRDKVLRVLENMSSHHSKAHPTGWQMLRAGTYDNTLPTEKNFQVLFCQFPRKRKCLDPRDKVFGLLGLTDGCDLWPQVDYTLSVEQVYSVVVMKFAEITLRSDRQSVAAMIKFLYRLAETLRVDVRDPVVIEGARLALNAMQHKLAYPLQLYDSGTTLQASWRMNGILHTSLFPPATPLEPSIDGRDVEATYEG